MEIVIIHDHPRPGIWCKTSHPHRKIKKGHSRLRRMTVRFLVSKKSLARPKEMMEYIPKFKNAQLGTPES